MEEGKASQSWKLFLTEMGCCVRWEIEIAAPKPGCSFLTAQKKCEMTVRFAIYTCVLPSCSLITDSVLHVRLRYISLWVAGASRWGALPAPELAGSEGRRQSRARALGSKTSSALRMKTGTSESLLVVAGRGRNSC